MGKAESGSPPSLGEEVELKTIAVMVCLVVLVILSFVAIASSGSGGCKSCEQVPVKQYAPVAGVIAYSSLLFLQYNKRARWVVIWGLMICLGAHIALVSQLLSQGVMCWLCFSVAAIAVVASAVAFVSATSGRMALVGVCTTSLLGALVAFPNLWPPKSDIVLRSRLTPGDFDAQKRLTVMLLADPELPRGDLGQIGTLIDSEFEGRVEVKMGTIPGDLFGRGHFSVVGYALADAIVLNASANYSKVRAEVIRKLNQAVR
jgi:hypothetical protein